MPDGFDRLLPEDVGIDPDGDLPFRMSAVEEPGPVLISCPHSGLEWPDRLNPRPQVNFRRNADYAVESLYQAVGATRIIARFSRLVVDLNRAEDDVDPELVPDHPAPRPRVSPGTPVEGPGQRKSPRNHGVIWGSAVGGIRLARRIGYEELQRRLDRYHRPYYRALEVLLARRIERFGHAVLIDAHSMPSRGAPDAVIGTLGGRTCSAVVRDAALECLRGAAGEGLDARLDAPYEGGNLIHHFGRPDSQVDALQIEVNRGLYMDELRLDAWTRDTSRSRIARSHPKTVELLDRLDGLVRSLTVLSSGSSTGSSGERRAAQK